LLQWLLADCCGVFVQSACAGPVTSATFLNVGEFIENFVVQVCCNSYSSGSGGVWDEGMICGFGVGMQFFDRFTRTERRVPV